MVICHSNPGKLIYSSKATICKAIRLANSPLSMHLSRSQVAPGPGQCPLWAVAIEGPQKGWGIGPPKGFTWPGHLGVVLSSSCSVDSLRATQPGCAQQLWFWTQFCTKLKADSLSHPLVRLISTGNSRRALRSPGWVQKTLGMLGKFR